MGIEKQPQAQPAASTRGVQRSVPPAATDPAGSPSSTRPRRWPAWPPDWPEIRHAVAQVLDDGSWGAYQGWATERLQTQLRQWYGADFVRLCSSGTAAVELALRAAGVQPGDEVMLSAIDYAGNFRSIELLGGHPVIVDTLPHRWDIDPAAVQHSFSGRTRALIVSHLYGNMAAMPQLRAWADEHQVVLIEDACQCPGAELDGRPAGRWGHVGVFSFGGSKPLTAGNGGAMVTDDPRLDQRAKTHALRPSDALPLSQMQAAALLPQLDRLPMLAAHRRRAAATLRAASPAVGGWTAGAVEARDGQADYYKLAWMAPHAAARDAAVQLGTQRGLPVGAGFASFGRRSVRRCRRIGPLPQAERCGACTLVLDHPVLLADDDHLLWVAEQLQQVQESCC